MKTTNEHFKLFKDTVLSYIEFLGLTGWCVDIEHEDIINSAQVTVLHEPREAIFVLGKEWDWEPTKKRIKEAAMHEVLELMLGRYDNLALQRSVSVEQLNEARHEVIQIILNKLVEL